MEGMVDFVAHKPKFIKSVTGRVNNVQYVNCSETVRTQKAVRTFFTARPPGTKEQYIVEHIRPNKQTTTIYPCPLRFNNI